MSRSLTPTAVALTTVVLAALLTNCAPYQPRMVPPPPLEEVAVNITGCETDDIGIVVRPWQAWVQRGRPLQWAVTGADSIAIAPLDPAQWPFQDPPTIGRPRMPARAGNVLPGAPLGHRYQYRILVYCGARVIDIDPDIIIIDPMRDIIFIDPMRPEGSGH